MDMSDNLGGSLFPITQTNKTGWTVCGCLLEAFSAVIGWRQGDTRDKSPVHRRAKHSHSHLWSVQTSQFTSLTIFNNPHRQKGCSSLKCNARSESISNRSSISHFKWMQESRAQWQIFTSVYLSCPISNHFHTTSNDNDSEILILQTSIFFSRLCQTLPRSQNAADI